MIRAGMKVAIQRNNHAFTLYIRGGFFKLKDDKTRDGVLPFSESSTHTTRNLYFSTDIFNPTHS